MLLVERISFNFAGLSYHLVNHGILSIDFDNSCGLVDLFLG